MIPEFQGRGIAVAGTSLVIDAARAELAASVGLQLAAADVLLLGRATCGSQAGPSASPAARPWSSR